MPFRRSLEARPRPAHLSAVVVDDDAGVAKAVARALERQGYRVVGIAHDPDAALAMIPALRPDVVVLDVDLRVERTGIDVAAALASLVSVPIVFLTGADEPPLEQLAGRGTYGYLAKPFTDTALRTNVELVRMQHEARDRLTALERHYHALFDQAAVGVAQVEGGSGKLVDVNRRGAAIFGATPEELVGRELAELAEPDQQASLRAALRHLGGGDAQEHIAELGCRRRDGTMVRVRLTAAPLTSSADATDHVVIVQDITDWWRAEELLARHRHLLAESQRMAAIGSFRLEYATGALMWTDEMYRIHGVSPTQFQPTTNSILPLIHPEDLPKVVRGMLPLGPDGVFEADFDYRITRPDGGLRMLHGRAELERDAEGNIAALLGTVQDVTERTRAVSDIRASAERARIATAASQAKTEFLANMSHELRTPLNAVLGLSEAMLERVFGDLTDVQATTLATIHDSGRHLLALINDVLDIARVESGNLPIEPELVLLRPLIDESTALMNAQLGHRGQRLVIDLAPALPPLDIDRRRIKQVLLNLLGNASKFSPHGATVTLRAAGALDAREVTIEVCDDGPGIAAADQGRVFEPFVTLDPSMTRTHGGAGLGLALARRIVELHGGRLELDSKVGRGSTFRITLPVAAAYVGEIDPAPRPAAPEPRRAAGGPVLLLAEDNEATVYTLRSYLERLGYDVRVARDGVEALAAGAQPEIAAVLMDVQLPGLDGLEVTRRLRASAAAAAKPIVALTAHAMPGDEARCLAAGATTYLPKPVRLRELADTIARLLEASP